MSRIFNNKPLPNGWMLYISDTGLPYFHNSLTAESQWEVPKYPDSGSASLGSTSVDLSVTGSNAAPATSFGWQQRRQDDGDVTTSATSLGPPSESSGRTLGGHQKNPVYAALNEDPDNLTGSIAGGDITMSGRDGFVKESGIVGSSAFASAGDHGGATGWWPFSRVLQSARPYFDVSTEQVLKRIKTSLFPLPLIKGATALATGTSEQTGWDNEIRSRPDFYGPFWIPTTLVFTLFALSNAAAYITGSLEKSNFQALILSFFLIYGFLLTVPSLVCLVTFALGTIQDREAWTLRQVFAVYGYSFSIVFPMAVLCVVPSIIFRWCISVVGSSVSLLFIVLHFRRDLVNSEPFLKLCLVGLFVVAQVSLYAMMPLYYFRL